MPKRTKQQRPKQDAKALSGQQAVNQAIWSICDIMRRSNCASAMQYVPELTWIMFLRILDEQDAREAEQAEALGVAFTPTVVSPYRWCDWAAPYSDRPDHSRTPEGKPCGWMRKQLFDAGSGRLFAFVNEQLLPALKNRKNRPGATAKQKVLSEVLSGVERTRIDTETNFADILDRVHGISGESVDATHVFTLSQVYEGLLLKMGERNSDGGQFFTPREVIRAMVKAIDPQAGETVCDPGCGTGGFLAQAYEHMRTAMGERASAAGLEQLKHRSFYGREKDNLIYPIALANLMLHGIDEPHLWHGNTLTGKTAYDGLYEGAPAHFDVVLTNPPFGGKEGADAQTNFVYKTSSTQVLFVQYVLKLLAAKGRCGIVLDEGLLFRTNEEAFVKTKRKLTDECNLWCILSLPGGAFTGAGAGVKTNLLFFTKGKPTQKIWYYDLSHIKVGKKTPLTLEHFRHFFDLLPKRATAVGETEFSWTIDFAARKAQAAKEAAPHHAEAERRSGEAAELREKIKALRKSDDKAKAAKTERLQTKLSAMEKSERDAKNKAQAIEDALYDLKAVNPNAKRKVDTRTPAELLDIIEQRGREVDAALAKLRALL